ncbi:MAG: hypothetical protein Sapg2KO_39190 [Saprospiraceae bacterium]
MKSLFSLTLLMLFGGLIFAAQLEPGNGDGCRISLKNINPELHPKEQVRLDLLQGNWQSETQQAIQWEFQDDGTVYLLSKQTNGAVSSTAGNWRIDYEMATPVLYLQNGEDRSTARYIVEQTCDGIELENIDNDEALTLDYVKAKPTAKRAALRQITGHWENTLNQQQVKAIPALYTGNTQSPVKVKLSLDFYADGSFAQVIESSERGITHEVKGKWVLSKDARTLILDLQMGDGMTQSQCLPIQYLELDEMVVSQVLPFKNGITADTDFYFNKY